MTDDAIKNAKGIKAFEFGTYLQTYLTQKDQIIRADGYKYMSEWWLYTNLNGTLDCIQKVNGCDDKEDVHCADRFALQK